MTMLLAMGFLASAAATAIAFNDGHYALASICFAVTIAWRIAIVFNPTARRK